MAKIIKGCFVQIKAPSPFGLIWIWPWLSHKYYVIKLLKLFSSMHAFGILCSEINFRPILDQFSVEWNHFHVEININFWNYFCFAQDSTRSNIPPPIEGLRMFRGLNEFVRTVVDNLWLMWPLIIRYGTEL